MSDNILDILLKAAVREKASDLHLLAKTNPRLRINGSLKELSLKSRTFTPEEINSMIINSVPPLAKNILEAECEVDYVYTVEDKETHKMFRFRVNAYLSQGNYNAVFRVIANNVFTLEDLRMPTSVGSLTNHNSGLILVTGSTGSGKSTTLAALINKINTTKSWVIITIEDPVEFIHKGQRSIIVQREIGVDTKSFPKALRAALRQDPNAIVIGEIRDKETADIALQSAQTGHLVLATLHASDAADTINRFTNLFPESEKERASFMLADTLKGVVCQRLIDGIDKRVAAVEVLINNIRIADIIRGLPGFGTIPEAMNAGTSLGMQTFEDSLIDLVIQNKITLESAQKNASNAHTLNLKLRAQGIK